MERYLSGDQFVPKKGLSSIEYGDKIHATLQAQEVASVAINAREGCTMASKAVQDARDELQATEIVKEKVESDLKVRPLETTALVLEWCMLFWSRLDLVTKMQSQFYALPVFQ